MYMEWSRTMPTIYLGVNWISTDPLFYGWSVYNPVSANSNPPRRLALGISKRLFYLAHWPVLCHSGTCLLPAVGISVLLGEDWSWDHASVVLLGLAAVFTFANFLPSLASPPRDYEVRWLRLGWVPFPSHFLEDCSYLGWIFSSSFARRFKEMIAASLRRLTAMPN